MVQSRIDPASASYVLAEALPALIEQAAGAGGPLALAVCALRTALSEAQRVGSEANEPSGATTSTVDALRRPSD